MRRRCGNQRPCDVRPCDTALPHTQWSISPYMYACTPTQVLWFVQPIGLLAHFAGSLLIILTRDYLIIGMACPPPPSPGCSALAERQLPWGAPAYS